jgi:hypothetical protein
MALDDEFRRVTGALLKINRSSPLAGERSDLLDQLAVLWSGIGAPGVQDLTRQNMHAAINYQIRKCVRTMLELGETRGNAASWANAARAKSFAGAEALLERVPFTGHASRVWAGRLHIAGHMTVAIDVTMSTIDVLASPPKERPKKILVHGSRIIAGLAGAARGGQWGARLGWPGAATGVVVGGYVGASSAKAVATFVADRIWPPGKTYIETPR